MTFDQQTNRKITQKPRKRFDSKKPKPFALRIFVASLIKYGLTKDPVQRFT